MSIYARVPYWWMKFEKDPLTGSVPRKPCSTGIYVDGGSTAQTKKNKADALALYQAECTALRNGTSTHLVTKKPAIRFRDYAPLWWAEHGQYHRSSRQAESNMRQIVRGLVRLPDGTTKPLGDFWLTDIDIPVVKSWRTERIAAGVKPKSAEKNISVLRVMLKHAGAYLDANPLFGLNTMGQKNYEPIRAGGHAAVRPFTKDEFKQFVQAIDAHDQIEGTPRAEGLALAYAAVETLLRRGNLLRLTWALDRGTHLVPLDPKVPGSIKRSPVSTNLRQLLDALPRGDEDTPVFVSHWQTPCKSRDPHKQLHAAENHVNEWFAAVCRLAKIATTRRRHGVTFHSFRHAGATWLLAAGVSVKVVMQLGGWTNANVFLNTYCHTSEEEVFAAADSLFAHRVRLKLVPSTQE